MPTANEELFDRTVRHAVFLERFKGGQVRELAKAYAALEADIRAQLARIDPMAVSGRFRRARLQKLLADVQEIIKAFSAQRRADFKEAQQGVLDIENRFGKTAVKGAVPLDWEWTLPAAAQVSAAINARPFEGRFLSEWFKGLEALTQERLRAAITQGVIEGQTTRDIAARIRQATLQSARGAEMVTRTALNHVSSVAREEFAEANNDIVKGVQWVSTLDARTSLICASRDGKVYPVGEGPRPPAHPNCRSTTVMVLKSWRELGIDRKDAPPGTRASMNGQVPADLHYGEWLKQQPVAVQEEMLGKAKARLFRDGGLSLDRFVLEGGQELDLAALRERYPKSFERAGLGGAPPVIPDDPEKRAVFVAAVRQSVEDKATRYLLAEEHPKGGDKAKWLRAALGITADDAEQLIRQVAYDPEAAVFQRSDRWGAYYEQKIGLQGLNGRTAFATFIWQARDGEMRLVTMEPGKKPRK